MTYKLPILGGDVTGDPSANTVVSVAHVTTGVLPAGNQAAQTLGGALGGTTAASTINLTGNASITGNLPVTNLAAGTTGQVLLTNGTTPTYTTLSGGATISATGVVTLSSGSMTLAGDVTGAANANTVVNLTGSAGAVNVTSGTKINFLGIAVYNTPTSDTHNFQVNGVTVATFSATGATITNSGSANASLAVLDLHSTASSEVAGLGMYDSSGNLQASMGYFSTNNELRINGYGNGAGIPINMYYNSIKVLTIGQYGIQPSQSTIALTTGTTTLSAAQQKTPNLVFTGTLTGTNTIAFNGVVGNYWLDFSAVTLGANAVILTNGAGTATITTLIVAGVSTAVVVVCNSVSTIAVS